MKVSASRAIKIVLLFSLILIIIGGIKALDLYNKVYSPNVLIKEKSVYIYIRSDYTYDSVFALLKKEKLLKNYKSFNWTAKKKNYFNKVNPGRYLVKNRMSNNQLINMLRSGKQEPVKLTFNSVRTIEQLAAKLDEQLEFDSDEFLTVLKNEEILDEYGFNEYTIPCMFIPNTYEVYWNISVSSFIKRMNSEYKNFWEGKRIQKAEKNNMSPEEVITLASIVNEETKKIDERPKVAGLYINRIKKGMPLQADPTIIFALGNFEIKRVLNKYKKIDSPYNTYMYKGLPPGPICLPDISSIDAVLDYQKHNYYYFCAKPDFSGYHNFARTYAEHNRNAREYQRELNKRRIYR